MLDLISKLTVYPGNYAFYLVLIVSIVSSLFLSFRNWRSSPSRESRRMIQGLAMLLLGLFFLIIVGGLQGSDSADAMITMPPLDRAFLLYSIIWIIWLWAFPETSRVADWAVFLLSLLVATASGLNILIRFTQFDGSTFNNSTNDLLWQAATLLMVLLGASLIIIRRPEKYTYGLCMLGLAFIGHTAHLIFRPEGNYSGILRLFYLSMFTILFALPSRLNLATGEVERPAEHKPKSVSPQKPLKTRAKTTVKTPEGMTVLTERRRYSTDPKTFHSMLALAAEANPDALNQAIPRAIAQAMLADLCFLVYLTENKNQLSIASGYDLIREEILEAGSFNKNTIPTVANAIQRGKPLRLSAGSTSDDIKGLGDLLGLSSPGHLMSVPITASDKQILGGIMLLSPYSDRVWSIEDQVFLSNIAADLVPILQRPPRLKNVEGQEAAITALEKRNQELIEQVEKLHQESAQIGIKPDEYSALVIANQESKRSLDQLRKENRELQAKASQQPESETKLTRELNSALEEVSRLRNQLITADQNIVVKESLEGGIRTKEQTEVVASLAQELRQPMSSVVGYTDLLLGESVGILGALQRKFVERIKGSIERISSLIDDMIQVTTLEVNLVDLKSEPVDLNQIIDNAMSYTSGQVREKNISMHLDLPKKVAHIHADQEALQQILIHLLQNAGSASPVEGSITLSVKTQVENGREHILIQVTDTGGGIPSEDLPRVFTRLYRADNVLIQGVGDTGVGLSIARTLTEAQNGRIWVESQMGVGSTFSVQLPIVEANESKPPKKKGKP